MMFLGYKSSKAAGGRFKLGGVKAVSLLALIASKRTLLLLSSAQMILPKMEALRLSSMISICLITSAQAWQVMT